MKFQFKKEYLKTIGWGAFLFFLIKGIAWLVLAYFVGNSIFGH